MKTDPVTSARMARVRNRDTAPELAVRRELHRRGRRFFVQRPLFGTRRRADILFPKAKVAVLVDGCFWHSCPEHATRPKRNAEWWAEKLATNVRRDRETDRLLAEAGWSVVRIWEHETPTAAADRVEDVLVSALSVPAAAPSQPPCRS